MFITFKEWSVLRESQKSETKCPRPKDREFCRKWRLYLDGQGPNPLSDTGLQPTRIGHDTTRSSKFITDRQKAKNPKLGKGKRQASKRIENDF